MSQTKPSIVFAHGLWADGSCFSKLIPTLQAEGYQVASSQHSLDTPEGDVAALLRTLGRVSSPAILVGHSYGGSVITAAGTDDRVAGLVYISALAPDETETSQSQQEQFPVTASVCSRQAPRTSRETCPSKSKSWSGQPRSRRPRTSSAATLRAPRGSPSRAGTSWPTTTTPSIPSWSASPRSAWAPRPTRSTAAMFPCSPSPVWCSTSSGPPPTGSDQSRRSATCRGEGSRWHPNRCST
jgi:pimeloyl-ACP methyl ester carboxylesterase